MRREPHDYTIEVCIECGAQLDRYGNGRCPGDRSHWNRGGMVLRVQPRSREAQEPTTQRRYGVVTPALEGTQGQPGGFTMKVRKRPVEVDAVQYSDNPDEVRRFLGESFVRWGDRSTIRIRTLEGNYTVQPGDWIIKGVEGEFYPCKPAIFAKTYEVTDV